MRLGLPWNCGVFVFCALLCGCEVPRLKREMVVVVTWFALL